MITPPKFCKNAIPSNRGWHDPKSGKLLVPCAGLLDSIRKEKTQQHIVVKSVPTIQLEVAVPVPIEEIVVDIIVPNQEPEQIQEQPQPKQKKRKKKEKQNEQNS